MSLHKDYMQGKIYSLYDLCDNKLLNNLLKEYNLKLKIYINSDNPIWGNTYDIGIQVYKGKRKIGYISGFDSRPYENLKFTKSFHTLDTLYLKEELRGFNISIILICIFICIVHNYNPDVRYIEFYANDKDLNESNKYMPTKQFKEFIYNRKNKNKFKLIKWYLNMGFYLIYPILFRGNIKTLLKNCNKLYIIPKN